MDKDKFEKMKNNGELFYVDNSHKEKEVIIHENGKGYSLRYKNIYEESRKNKKNS